jgi:hypothetical protein
VAGINFETALPMAKPIKIIREIMRIFAFTFK